MSENVKFLMLVIVSNLLFYFMGKYTERKAWNKLIQQGKLPKPKIK